MQIWFLITLACWTLENGWGKVSDLPLSNLIMVVPYATSISKPLVKIKCKKCSHFNWSDLFQLRFRGLGMFSTFDCF